MLPIDGQNKVIPSIFLVHLSRQIQSCWSTCSSQLNSCSL